MRPFLRRRSRPGAAVRVKGVARVGSRTKELATRVGRGDIAVIDHRDLDRIAAESLLEAGVSAIVNADHSISGRYPNGGPERVMAAGVPLLDAVGSAVMENVCDGELVEIRDNALWRDGEKLAAGELLTADEVAARMDDARLRMGTELRSFARNTLEYIDREAEQTFEPLVPSVFLPVEHAMAVHDPPHVARPVASQADNAGRFRVILHVHGPQ